MASYACYSPTQEPGHLSQSQQPPRLDRSLSPPEHRHSATTQAENSDAHSVHTRHSDAATPGSPTHPNGYAPPLSPPTTSPHASDNPEPPPTPELLPA